MRRFPVSRYRPLIARICRQAREVIWTSISRLSNYVGNLRVFEMQESILSQLIFLKRNDNFTSLLPQETGGSLPRQSVV